MNITEPSIHHNRRKPYGIFTWDKNRASAAHHFTWLAVAEALEASGQASLLQGELFLITNFILIPNLCETNLCHLLHIKQKSFIVSMSTVKINHFPLRKKVLLKD